MFITFYQFTEPLESYMYNANDKVKVKVKWSLTCRSEKILLLLDLENLVVATSVHVVSSKYDQSLAPQCLFNDPCVPFF